VHRLRAVLLEHPHENEIDGDLEDAAVAVLALAGRAGIVLDDDLADARAVHRRVHGDEAVHFAVEARVANDVGAVGLQRAAVIVQLHAGDAADEPVGGAGDLGPEPGVLAVLAPAADDVVVALFEHVAEAADFLGRILAVAVQRHDDRCAGRPESGHQRSGLAVIAGQVDDAEARLAGRQFIQQRPGPIAAPVIHDDQLEAPALGRQRPHELRNDGRNAGFLLEDRHDDRNFGTRREHRRLPQSGHGGGACDPLRRRYYSRTERIR